MIPIGAIIIFCNAALLFLLYYNFYYKRRKLPPGPTPVPILGNLLSIFNNPPGEKCYVKWAKQYGAIYTFWLGEQPIIIVSDSKKILEAFQKDGETYSGRFVFAEMENLLKGGTYGVVFSEGDLWREQRRFALQVFRDFGVGKNVMQEKILTEIGLRFKKIDEEIDVDTEINIAAMIDIAVGSIINSIIFNGRFDGEETKKFYQLKTKITSFIQMAGDPRYHLLSYNPHFFKNFPFFKSFLKRLMESRRCIEDFMMEKINAHHATLDLTSDAPPTDYVEAFLRERAKRESTGEFHYFTDIQLEQMCFDLWSAGQETTSTTLAWGMVYLIHHPEVQKKMQEEMDSVVGSPDCFITVDYRPKLPYICAVINEIQRLCNLLPMNLFHKTTKDTEIGGYFIPEGTCIVPQISAVLYNEKYYENADEFNPNRFLTENGQFKKCDDFMPFGVGKRQCLGEPLARMELFLFLANIFNKYKVTSGKEMPSRKRKLGAAVSCPPFLCRMEKRIANPLLTE